MLRNRSLLALLSAEIVSTTGTTMTFLALPWFVLVTTGSATRMSAVLAAEILPVALFGIPSGSLVGRLGARRSMMFGDLLRAPLIASVPLLHWAGALTFPLLLAIVFAIGLFSAPYFAAQRTILPELFGDDETLVGKVAALVAGATHITLVVGPAAAGLLISAVGAPTVLLIDGATYLVAFALVALFVAGGKPVPQDDDTRGVLAGVRYIARDPLFGPMTLTVVLLDGAAGAISVGVPLLAYARYGRDVHVGGWLFTAFGIGAVAGSFLAIRLIGRFRPLRLASAAIVLATLPLWVLAAPVSWQVACVATLLCGLFIPMVNSPMMGLLTTRPPAAVRAKVMTAIMTASALGGPAGRLAIGPIYDAWGNAGVWIAIAGGMSVGAILFAGAALRGDRREAFAAAAPVS